MLRRRCRRCRLMRALRDTRVLGFLAVWFGVNIIFGVGSIAIGADGAQRRLAGAYRRIFRRPDVVFAVRSGAARDAAMLRMRHSPDAVEQRLIAACGARAISFIIAARCDATQSNPPCIAAALA